MTYTLKITKQEYELILAAVDAYHANLRQKVVDQVAASLLKATPAEVPVLTKKEAKPKKRKGRIWTPEDRMQQAERARQTWAKRKGVAA